MLSVGLEILESRVYLIVCKKDNLIEIHRQGTPQKVLGGKVVFVKCFRAKDYYIFGSQTLDSIDEPPHFPHTHRDCSGFDGWYITCTDDQKVRIEHSQIGNACSFFEIRTVEISILHERFGVSQESVTFTLDLRVRSARCKLSVWGNLGTPN